MSIDRKQDQSLPTWATPEPKKEKIFILIACSEKVDTSLVSELNQHIMKKYPSYVPQLVKSAPELAKSLVKKIALLVIDDFFSDIDVMMRVISTLKNKSSIPVLFLSSNPPLLINHYSKNFGSKYPADSYIDITQETDNVTQKIDSLLNVSHSRRVERRRSKRLKTLLPVECYDFNSQTVVMANIIEISLHGAIIEYEKYFKNSIHTQLQIALNINRNIIEGTDDIIKIAARIERLFLSGYKVAVSWSYLSLANTAILTKIITTSSLEKIKENSK